MSHVWRRYSPESTPIEWDNISIFTACLPFFTKKLAPIRRMEGTDKAYEAGLNFICLYNWIHASLRSKKLVRVVHMFSLTLIPYFLNREFPSQTCRPSNTIHRGWKIHIWQNRKKDIKTIIKLERVHQLVTSHNYWQNKSNCKTKYKKENYW